MSDCESPAEESLENGSSLPREQKTAFLGAGMGGPHEIKPGEQKWSLTRVVHQCKKYRNYLAEGDSSKITVMDIVILAVLAVLLVISLAFNAYQAARQARLRAALGQLNIISCPQNWMGDQQQRRCYYFSETEETWDFGLQHCSAYNASLVKIECQQELDFAMHSKGPSDYWIGLRRDAVGQAWKWPSGALFWNWFPIGGEGLCAYLDGDGVRSATCTEKRRWICSRSPQAM